MLIRFSNSSIHNKTLLSINPFQLVSTRSNHNKNINYTSQFSLPNLIGSGKNNTWIANKTTNCCLLVLLFMSTLSFHLSFTFRSLLWHSISSLLYSLVSTLPNHRLQILLIFIPISLSVSLVRLSLSFTSVSHVIYNPLSIDVASFRNLHYLHIVSDFTEYFPSDLSETPISAIYSLILTWVNIFVSSKR